MARPTVSVSARILAPPNRVWELVSDIALMPRFSDELQSVEWIDGGTPLEGARFAGTNSHPAMGTWTTVSQIVECMPPQVFAWAVGDPEGPAATWRFDLCNADGDTDLRFTACIGPGNSGVSTFADREPHRRDEILSYRLGQFEEGMTKTLAGLKELAEQAAAPQT